MVSNQNRLRVIRRSLGFSLLLLLVFLIARDGKAQVIPTAQTVVGYKEFGGKLAQVEVIFAPKPGVDPAIAATKALHSVGVTAAPPWSGYLLIGFAWAEFSDHSRRNNAVTINYNPAGDPTGGDGIAAIGSAINTWNTVPGSMFRYKLGGSTTRCPSLIDECTGGAAFLGIPGATYPDSYNDFGWVPIPLPPDFPGVIFGYFIDLVDPFTGQAFETDLVLNTQISPFAWRTDGVDGFPNVDVETIFLHELGHALGLAHAFNEDALMYFNYSGVQRTLTPSEIDGVLALYPKHPSLLSDTPSAHDFSIVAEAYTSAPGGGDFMDTFEAGGVNARGDVAFVTNVPEGQGLFVASRGENVRQIVRSGMPAPGGLEFGLGSADETAINDAGEIGFCWFLGPVELPFGVNAGLFRADAAGSLRAVMLPGVTAAPGGGVFVGCDAASISNFGDIAFNGFVLRGSNLEQSAFVARRDGTFIRIAGPGDAAPGGGVFLSAQHPKIAPNGSTVVFHAVVGGSPNPGVYVSRGLGGNIEAIALPGDPAAGGGTIVRVRGRSKVNSRGEVLYGAQVELSPGLFRTELFLSAQGKSSRRVAGYGDMMPDGFLFGTLVIIANSWTLNEAGDVSFVARTESVPLPFFGSLGIFETTGVYACSHGELRFVAREGSVLLGLGKMVSVSASTAPAMIDERGNVVFETLTDAGRLVLVRAAPHVR